MSPQPHQRAVQSGWSFLMRLWTAWCMALVLLGITAPAQAAITAGTIVFGNGHANGFTEDVSTNYNGLTFSGQWVYYSNADLVAGGFSGVGASGDAITSTSFDGNAIFKSASSADRFNVLSAKLLAYGANMNQFTFTGYRGGVPQTPVVIVTTVPMKSQFVTIDLSGLGNVDEVRVSNDSASEPYNFAIDDLAVEPAVPVISSLSPNSGPTAGGNSVTITGKAFSGVASSGGVAFGSNGATYTVNSDTQITATAPPGSGTVNVAVTSPQGTNANSGSNAYTYVPPPTVTAISPTTGPTAGGTTVIITGTDLTDATSVTFGATAAIFTVDSSTQITVTSPAGTGTVDVRVTTSGGTSSISASDQFTYVSPPVANAVSATVAYNSNNNSITLNITGGVPTSVSVASGASNGTAVASGLSITYTPTAGYSGADSFTYTATNAGGTSAPATASITVSPPAPVANSVSATVAYGSTNNPITLNITGGAATSVAVASAASHGTAVASGTSITYTPAAAYGGPDSFTYTATNGTGTSAPATVSITVNAPTISYAPSNPPNGTAGVAYSQSIASASGGTGPYTYTVVSGSPPAGITLNSNGTLTGTSSVVGTANFSVRATDSSSATAPATGPYSSSNQSLALTISAPTITMAPGTLPNATVGTAYSQTLTASGGASPYTYVVTAGALPAGLAVNLNSGALTGTATAAGSFNFTVTATDNGSFTGSQAYALQVNAPTLSLLPNTLPNPTAGVAYSQSVTAGGGTSPYTYALTAGALPSGLSLSAGGVISGSATATGTFNFSITATDSSTGTGAPFTAMHAYTLVVSAPTITVTPSTLPNGAVDAAYSQSLTAGGGLAPYGYAVTSGALPTGLMLGNTSGVLSGTPTATGTFNFTVTATDANSFTGSQAYSVTITPSANADLSALSLDSGTLSPTFSAGTTAYTASLANAITSVTVTPTVARTGATVTVNGIPVASGAASGPITLNLGSNLLTIVVTAPNGTTTKTYTVAATRLPLQSVTDGASGMTLSIANSGPTCTLTSTQFTPSAAVSPAPPTGYTYLYSAAGFTAMQCAPGSDLTVTLTFPNPVPAGAVLMKYNAALTPPWQPLTPVISGNQATYTISDGSTRDNDGAVNGEFVDPVLLALPLSATAVPTLGEWGMLLLTLLTGAVGWGQMRRRHLR